MRGERRRDGILEDHLDLRPQSLEFPAVELQDVERALPSSKVIVPLSGVTARIRILLTVVLPQAAFADEPEAFTAADVEADIVDSAMPICGAAAEPAGAARGKRLRKVADGHEDIGTRGFLDSRSPTIAPASPALRRNAFSRSPGFMSKCARQPSNP